MHRLLMAIALSCAVGTAAAETPLERGGYLVNTIMTCNNCHTPMGPNGPDFSKALSGGLTFDTPAFTVTASNITPDKDTGIGTWSEAELKAFLTTGMRPNGVPVAPIMPTAYYTILTPGDLDAIVAYLRSLPAIPNKVPAPSYKVKLPGETVPFASPAMTTADLTDKLKRGTYLATIGHCLECHTPLGPAGHDFGNAMGKGGQSFPGPWGTSTSANITSHPTKGLGGWSDEEIKRAITQGIARDGHRLKPPMGFPFYANMTADDLDAVVAFVRTLPALD